MRERDVDAHHGHLHENSQYGDTQQSQHRLLRQKRPNMLLSQLSKPKQPRDFNRSPDPAHELHKLATASALVEIDAAKDMHGTEDSDQSGDSGRDNTLIERNHDDGPERHSAASHHHAACHQLPSDLKKKSAPARLPAPTAAIARRHLIG